LELICRTLVSSLVRNAESLCWLNIL
jgi:hypothetical protein